jgi:hypothetical protein
MVTAIFVKSMTLVPRRGTSGHGKEEYIYPEEGIFYALRVPLWRSGVDGRQPPPCFLRPRNQLHASFLAKSKFMFVSQRGQYGWFLVKFRHVSVVGEW